MSPTLTDRPRPMPSTGRLRLLPLLPLSLLALAVTMLTALAGAQDADDNAPADAPADRGDSWAAHDPEDLVIYHVMIDRFENGDPTNDSANPRTSANYGDPRGWHGGDLEGVRQRLGYIKGLGANALWLSPLTENVNAYHGYATYDWYNVEPNFGDMEKLQQLINEAHDLGIAVYFDMVAGHMANLIVGDEDGWPSYRAPPNGYTMRWRNSNFRYPAPFDSPVFFHNNGHIPSWTSPEQELGELSDLDDLATDTQYVRDEMTNIWNWWITQTNVDGFRIDTVKHVDRGFWEDFLPRIRAHAEGLGHTNHFTFGEIFGGDDWLMRQYIGELDGAPYKMDAALDFQFYYMAGGVFARGDAPTVNYVNRLVSRENQLGTNHHMKMPNFIDNHDVSRFMSTTEQVDAPLATRLRRLELGLVAMFMAPGPPVVYYGTEQGFDGPGDPSNRYDMFDGQYESGPSEGDNFDEDSDLYRLVARLGAARRDLVSLRRGEFQAIQSSGGGPGILAFVRRHEGEAVFVAMNTSMSEVAFDGATVPEFAGEMIANLFDPGVGVSIGGDGLVGGRTIPAQAAEVWTLQSALPPAAPGIALFSPGPGELLVDPTIDAIEITFLTPMVAESTNARISVSPTVAYTPSWSPDGRTVMLALDAQLATNTAYTVSVAHTAETQDGQTLGRNFAAEWTTGRLPIDLPSLPAPVALPATSIDFIIDGDDSEWPTSAVAADTGEVTAGGTYVWVDSTGDDDGPGGYTYPTNSAFSEEEADFERVSVAWNNDRLFVAIRPVSVNPSAGFFTPYYGIALDYADGGDRRPFGVNVSTGTVGVSDVAPRDDVLPDAEIAFTGTVGTVFYRDGVRYPAIVDVMHSTTTGVVELSVPWSVFYDSESGPAGPPPWLNLYVYSGLESFGSMREVQATTQQWEPGGGLSAASDPDVFDMIGASVTDQRDDLSLFDNFNTTVVRRGVLRFVLGEQSVETSSGITIW